MSESPFPDANEYRDTHPRAQRKRPRDTVVPADEHFHLVRRVNKIEERLTSVFNADFDMRANLQAMQITLDGISTYVRSVANYARVIARWVGVLTVIVLILALVK